MNENNQNNQTTIKVHTYEQKEPCYPFAIVEETTIVDETEVNQNYKIALGNTIVDENVFTQLIMAEDYIKSKPYSLILALMCSVIEAKEKFEKEQQELLKHKENESK